MAESYDFNIRETKLDVDWIDGTPNVPYIGDYGSDIMVLLPKNMAQYKGRKLRAYVHVQILPD